jgi:hypothetical protein
VKKFDLIICDMTTPQAYEKQTLEVQGLGGTEASVIRVAEGLGSLGARVGVVQHCVKEPVMGEHAFYLPLSYMDEVDTHNFVSLRGTHFLDKFPKAQKYSWHEDVWSQEFAETCRPAFVQTKTTVIGASEWHAGQIKGFLHKPDADDNPRVVHIYNPIEDHLFVPKSTEVKYDPNKLCWVASPHKGFSEGLKMFNKLVEVSGNKNFRLYTFNPGYLQNAELFQNRYIVDVGPVPCKEVWQHVSESLCLFYPTQFEETFGNIAAEANAVHTPVLTCKVAALAETVSSDKQFVEYDVDKVIDRIMQWHRGERPKVWGQERFRHSNVILDWVRLLSRPHYL